MKRLNDKKEDPRQSATSMICRRTVKEKRSVTGRRVQ